MRSSLPRHPSQSRPRGLHFVSRLARSTAPLQFYSRMPKIVQLPDHVANQIAAGEVVERPVAVVKELVENSLDAGATRIEVEFRQGGKRLIRVTDNGSGMDAEDAVRCLQRHATSKIRAAEDLQHILSFGFRGEALPSIASVSDFLLRTRTPEAENGTELRVSQGRVSEPRVCGMSPGTHIEVARLFNTVPARRKFLKSDATEAAHMTHLCRLLAVAHPEIAFTLIEDQRVVFRSPECATLRARVQEIFGQRLGQELIDLDPVELVRPEGTYRLYGLLGEPGVGRATRADMLVYVNRRPVDSRLVQYGLIEAYHSYLPNGRYPVAYLFLEVPPAVVDVNVHPAKREVRFRDETWLRSMVMEGVLATLRKARRETLRRAETVDDFATTKPEAEPEPVPVGVVAPAPTLAEAASADVPKASVVPRPTPLSAARPSPAPVRRPLAPAVAAPPMPLRAAEPEVKPVVPATKPAPVRAKDVPLPPAPAAAQLGWRLLGLAHGNLAWLESREGVVCLDVRAALERVTYERLEAQWHNPGATGQGLLFPLSLELPPLDADALDRHGETWTRLGFGVEPFGRHFYRITSIPAGLDPGRAAEFLRDLVGLVREQGGRSVQFEDLQANALRLAVRQIVRQSPPLDEAEVLPLARALLSCRQPLADLDGKPTFFELRQGELRQRLGW